MKNDQESSRRAKSKAAKLEFREDVLLPEANITRLMKISLPPNTKIAKLARVCVVECVSEFISFITGEASDICQSNGRKTIASEDVLKSLEMLGFNHYVKPLKFYLKKYRETGLIKRHKTIFEKYEEMSDVLDSSSSNEFVNPITYEPLSRNAVTADLVMGGGENSDINHQISSVAGTPKSQCSV